MKLNGWRLGAAAVAMTAMFGGSVLADDGHDDMSKPIRADGHAPIGVMGDHMHKAGEFMASYRYMRMDMAGNRIGDDSVSPDEIAVSPNRFGMPATLRVVPTEMTMDMHMFGLMYAPTDMVTLMAMLNYIEKDMDHITYQGVMGTNRLGTFNVTTKGLGDLPVSALVRLYDSPNHKVHLNLGLSAPTGSITKKAEILTPMGMRPTLRVPYAMQLGSGTWDALPGITYNGRSGDLTWGAQYRGTVRLEDENDEGYRLGDVHQGTAWLAYQWAPWISTSFRVEGKTVDSIHGIDSEIAVPNQTADPDNYGGETVALYGGINLVGQSGDLRGHRLAFEIGGPVYQDLNGPQMETDWTFTVGWQKAF